MGSDMLRAAALHSLVNALPPDGQAQQGPGPDGQGVMSQQQGQGLGMGMGLPAHQQQRLGLGLPAQQQASLQQGHMALLGQQQLRHGLLPPHQQHQQHSQAMFLSPQGQAGQMPLQQQAPHAFPAEQDPNAQATVGQIQHYYEVLLHQQQVQNLLQQQQLNVLLLQQAQQQKQQQQPTRSAELWLPSACIGGALWQAASALNRGGLTHQVFQMSVPPVGIGGQLGQRPASSCQAPSHNMESWLRFAGGGRAPQGGLDSVGAAAAAAGRDSRPRRLGPGAPLLRLHGSSSGCPPWPGLGCRQALGTGMAAHARVLAPACSCHRCPAQPPLAALSQRRRRSRQGPGWRFREHRACR